jgi:hypothetical protein
MMAEHPSLGRYRLDADGPATVDVHRATRRIPAGCSAPRTHAVREGCIPRLADFGRTEAVNPDQRGTKAAAVYKLELPPASRQRLRLRLRAAYHLVRRSETTSTDIRRPLAEADQFLPPAGPC